MIKFWKKKPKKVPLGPFINSLLGYSWKAQKFRYARLRPGGPGGPCTTSIESYDQARLEDSPLIWNIHSGELVEDASVIERLRKGWQRDRDLLQGQAYDTRRPL